MKHFRLARLLPCLLLSLCPALLGHCGGALEHATETGNPPVVEQQKLHVVLHENGVEVVGEAGAVSPGASVAVTNTRSGDHAESIARADGSVNVSVAGTLSDEYEVTVSSGGGSQSVRVTASNADPQGDPAGGTNDADANANLSDAELASASCNALESTLGQRVADGFTSGDTQCRSDDDCMYLGWGVSCYYQCGSSFLSVNGAARAQAQIEESTAPVCAELQNRCMRAAAQSCPGTTTTTAECANGVCQGLELGSLSCNELSNTTSARMGTLVGNADRGCMQDADCTLYNPSADCAFNCSGYPTALALSAVPALSAGIERIEDRFCVEFRNRTCPGPFPLPCPAPLLEPRAVCLLPSLGGPGALGQCSLISTQR